MINSVGITALLYQLYNASTYHHLFPTSVNWQQGIFLAQLIRQIRPLHLIEIGCGYGISSLWVASARWISLKHTIIDPYSKPLPEIGKILKKVKSKYIGNKDSQHYLAELDAKKESVDCFMIDGDERFDGCITDLYFANRLLRVNGYLIIRNHWNPSVRKAGQFLLKNLPYKLVGLSPWEQWLVQRLPLFLLGYFLYSFTDKRTAGLIILQKTTQDQRPWNHFVRFC